MDRESFFILFFILDEINMKRSLGDSKVDVTYCYTIKIGVPFIQNSDM